MCIKMRRVRARNFTISWFHKCSWNASLDLNAVSISKYEAVKVFSSWRVDYSQKISRRRRFIQVARTHIPYIYPRSHLLSICLLLTQTVRILLNMSYFNLVCNIQKLSFYVMSSRMIWKFFLWGIFFWWEGFPCFSCL